MSWKPNSNIIYEKNIHGYPSTPKISSLELWKKYINKRINETLDGVERITIADFLETAQFLNNKLFDDRFPEAKRVFNRFKDPLPPYDFIWPYGDRYAYNGVRRTWDYAITYLRENQIVNDPSRTTSPWGFLTGRIDQYYKRLYSLDSAKKSHPYGIPWRSDRSLVAFSEDFSKKRPWLNLDYPTGINSNTVFSRQRREWGFREKILQGFPYFFPKVIVSRPSIQNLNLNVIQPLSVPGKSSGIKPSQPNRLSCGIGPVIVGVVTAGSGIFSGIRSSANISFDFSEIQKTVNSPTDIPEKEPKIPTGLIFIQDETGAIGFNIGTDYRYMHNPLFHNSGFAESSLFSDPMHLGSLGLPKPDYRQFLREGDLIYIQMGVGFKYWHPVLGTQPKDWESLFGTDEYKKLDRKLVDGEADVTQAEKIIPPYIDNWGGNTNPATNKSYEAAINIPNLELGFGLGDEPHIFDSIKFGSTSLKTYLEELTATVEGIVAGVEKGFELGTKYDPFPPYGTVIAVIIGGIVGGVATWAFYESLYYRRRYILPSRIARDGQWPLVKYHPIQENHPWSTGTPVPVNNGMQYIMADVFSIDTRERFSPPPELITNAQLRGIPEDTWKWDPDLEWKIPEDFQNNMEEGYLDSWPYVSPTSLYMPNEMSNPQREFVEFPGINREPDTPYTENPGSKYKGKLIKLKNVTFVEPPETDYFVPKLASEAEIAALDEERKKILSDFRKHIESGKFPKDFHIPLKDLPSFESRIPQILIDIEHFLEYALPIFDLALTFFSTFFSEAFHHYGGEVIEAGLQEAEKLEKRIMFFMERVKEVTEKGVSGFTSEVQISEFLTVKHGVDYRGFKISVDYPYEILNTVHRSIGTINIGDFYRRFGIGIIRELMAMLGLETVGNFIQAASDTWDNFKLDEIPETNEHKDGYIGREFIFEKIKGRSEYPMSIDKKDGGYWWTNPNIPLTNARSHANDANFGNPATEDDNEGDFLYPNQDVYTTERTVFTQLISTTPQNTTNTRILPSWDYYYIQNTPPKNAVIEEFKTYEYNMTYIRQRKVEDLGEKFKSSYSPFAEEWKPYRYDPRYKDIKTVNEAETLGLKNEFKPLKPGNRFIGNRTYYVKDSKNVVVPIRINANTEISRYSPLIPTGSVDIVGIAWQYSLGKPGLEWERERYVMQVWPRYLSDVGIQFTEPNLPELPEVDDRDREPPTGDPPPPPPPRKLPDLTLDIGDAGNPARLDCESVRFGLDGQNKLNQELRDALNWPVSYASGDVNVHKDPVTGMQRSLPSDPVKAKEFVNSLKDYPCKGMNIGEEQEVVITSSTFPGVSRRFHFRVGPNGECICTAYQGTRKDDDANTNTMGGDSNKLQETFTRIPDIVIEVNGERIPLSDINQLSNCDNLQSILSNDALKQQYFTSITGGAPTNTSIGCDGLKPGEEVYITLMSEYWYGLKRRFRFRKDKNGRCICELISG